MSSPYAALIADPPADRTGRHVFSNSLAGSNLFRRLFAEHNINPAATLQDAPLPALVASFMETHDQNSGTFPYNCAIIDPGMATAVSNATVGWEVLLLESKKVPDPKQALPTTPSPPSNEKRQLATTLETRRIRMLAHSAAGAVTGVAFF